MITIDCIETVAVLQPSDFETIQYLNSEVAISKTNGIPNYFDTEYQVVKPISKSHHGRFEKLVSL